MIHPCGIILPPPYPSFPRKRESTPGNQTTPPATRHSRRPPPSFPRKRESTPHNQTPPPATRHYCRPPPSFPRKRESTPHNQTPPPAALQPTGTEKPPFRKRGVGGITPPPPFNQPPACPSLPPPPIRHSRESGNPHPTIRQRHLLPAIPAPIPVIPAKAGIHTPSYRYAGAYRGSGFRPTPE